MGQQCQLPVPGRSCRHRRDTAPWNAAPWTEILYNKLKQIHPLLFTSRYSFSHQPRFTRFTQHKHLSHYRPWQFKQVKRTARTFQQEIIYSFENYLNIAENCNEFKSDLSESESDKYFKHFRRTYSIFRTCFNTWLEKSSFSLNFV